MRAESRDCNKSAVQGARFVWRELEVGNADTSVNR